MACMHAAEAHGLLVRDEDMFVDNGVGAARTLGRRAGVVALRRSLRKESVCAVVVQDLSRFSRDVIELMVLLKDLQDGGIRVIEAKGSARRE